MGGLVKDWRVPTGKNPDDLLDKAPAFSRPICAQIREWIFRWEPDLDESVKWGALCYKGHKLVAAVGAFKKHAGVTFFRGSELDDRAHLFNQGEGNASLRTIRITTLEGFNREALRALLRAAVLLDLEPSLPAPPPAKRPPLPMPAFFKEALKKHPKSAAGFKTLAPTYQREYINWLRTAKQPETRARRLAETPAAAAKGLKYAQRKQA